jgi:hypothetical protein
MFLLYHIYTFDDSFGDLFGRVVRAIVCSAMKNNDLEEISVLIWQKPRKLRTYFRRNVRKFSVSESPKYVLGFIALYAKVEEMHLFEAAIHFGER